MTADTTAPSYWLNWRFFLCALWILTAVVLSALLIWKNEGPKKSRTGRRDNWQHIAGPLYKDEAWRTSLKVLHPAWLLAYRVIAFSFLLALLLANAVVKGPGIFYFYTQWTFTLVTVYFGLASLFSIYGCCQLCKEVGGDGVNCVALDEEQVIYVAPTLDGNADTPNMSESLNSHEEPPVHKTAGIWDYGFQIIYQICAGAVVLTDCVFWFVLYPFFTPDGTKLEFFDVGLHSINAVLLLGEMNLNCLRFPFFRIAYFVLWTCIFVIFQWIIHACVSMWWPYQFLDLLSPYAPIWYLAVGVLHFPCYGVFVFLLRMKHFCLLRLFPNAFAQAMK